MVWAMERPMNAMPSSAAPHPARNLAAEKQLNINARSARLRLNLAEGRSWRHVFSSS
jgi:hypothetical protein